MGFYEVESIENANTCTILINKKHKGVRKDTSGTNFESYAERIHQLREIDTIKPYDKKIVQKRLQVKNTEMKMANVSKVQLPRVNDNCYYLSDGITSFPYIHPLLSEIRNLKMKV